MGEFMRTRLGVIGNSEVFLRETRTDGVYGAGDRVILRDRSTHRERTLTPQQARCFFQSSGIHLVPGEHLEAISREIEAHGHATIRPATHESLSRYSLAQADRYLHVGNYRQVLRNLGLAVTHARLAGIDPDAHRISDIYSQGVHNLSQLQANGGENVSRLLSEFGNFGTLLSRTNNLQDQPRRLLESALTVFGGLGHPEHSASPGTRAAGPHR